MTCDLWAACDQSSLAITNPKLPSGMGGPMMNLAPVDYRILGNRYLFQHHILIGIKYDKNDILSSTEEEIDVIFIMLYQGCSARYVMRMCLVHLTPMALLLTWINFNSSMDK